MTPKNDVLSRWFQPARSSVARTDRGPATLIIVTLIALFCADIGARAAEKGALQRSSAPAVTPASALSRAPAQDYLLYVVCESADKVVLLRRV